MNIAIIGSGNVGQALAKSLMAHHEVVFGVRNPESDKAKAAVVSVPGISVLSISSAVMSSKVIIVTTSIDGLFEAVGQFGDCSEKVIIDATNSVFKKPEPFANGFELIKAKTNCRDIVKCFNSTGAENMANPVYAGKGIDMFAAGSSVQAKDIARQLALDAGFEVCHDFGGDDKVALLEQLALVWINLAMMQKQGRDIAIKVLRR